MPADARSTTVAHESGDQHIPPERLARIRAEYREMPGLCLTPAHRPRGCGA
jgi:hypothetical protein